MHFNNAKEKSISWVSFQVYDVAYRGLSIGRTVLLWGLLGLQNMWNIALLLHVMHMSRKHVRSGFNNIRFPLCFCKCADVKRMKETGLIE